MSWHARATALVTVILGLFGAREARAHVGRAIAVDRQGRVYFIDTVRNRLWRIERDGRLTLVQEGIHSDVLLLGANGELYAQHDYYDGTAFRSTWWRITESGEPVAIPTALVPARDTLPKALDAAGNLFAADDAQRIVQQIAPDGRLTTVARLSWPWHPTGVAVGPAGEVYVLERNGDYRSFWGAVANLMAIADMFGNPRVQMISPDGGITTVVTLARPHRGLLVASLGATLVLLAVLWRWWRRQQTATGERAAA